jgi:hypothetical protein
LGDVGAGIMANNLKLGCDCLGSIYYLSAVLVRNLPVRTACETYTDFVHATFRPIIRVMLLKCPMLSVFTSKTPESVSSTPIIAQAVPSLPEIASWYYRVSSP